MSRCESEMVELVVEVRGLTKNYGRIAAVDGVVSYVVFRLRDQTAA